MKAKNRSGIEIEKSVLKRNIKFAIEKIPNTHQKTLQALWDLVSEDGTHGSVDHRKIVEKMRQVMRFTSNACPQTLLILADLVDLKREFSQTMPPVPGRKAASAKRMATSPTMKSAQRKTFKQ